LYKTVVRIYRIPPQARGDIQSFLEALSKRIKAPIASISVRENLVRIELSGSKSQVYGSLEAIRRFLSEYKVEVGKKARTFTFGMIEDIAGIGIPVDTLEEILKLKGYPAWRKAKKSIETIAPKNIVEEEARKLAETYKMIVNEKMSKTAMKMVTVASAYLGVNPLEVIENAIKMGILVRHADGRLRMEYSWRGALREFIRAYKKNT